MPDGDVVAMEKTKINLDILLPGVPDERDACVARIIDRMQKHKGLEDAHIVGAGKDAQLCFHYDSDIVSLQQVENMAREAGADITAHYGHLLLEVKAFREANEATGVENELQKLSGVSSASVSASGHIRVEFDRDQLSNETIVGVLQKNKLQVIAAEETMHPAGQKVVPVKADSCCSTEEEHHEKDDGHNHGDEQEEGCCSTDAKPQGRELKKSGLRKYAPALFSLAMLLIGLAIDNLIKPEFFSGWIRFAWYVVAYLPVGYPVAKQGFRLMLRGDVFTEFLLMTIATVGAFYIGEYPEGVTVMLFYTIGELFQDAAVNSAKRSIKALLDIRPASAWIKQNSGFIEIAPQKVQVGDVIQIKAGDKVPLDGEMLSEGSTFNTAALTGESRPSEIVRGETVLAGMINQDRAVELRVTKAFHDSSLSRILSLVQEATTRKAKTEQFIRKFARIYTPIVVFVAIGITLLPYFFVDNYVFNTWLYRALIFLVISCPCALVISIPLGYFGGIGAASRNGILFKGSNFLDLMTKVTTVVMDKTGTLTKGVFKVQSVVSTGSTAEAEWLPMAAALEAASSHPVAQAVVAHVGANAGSVVATDLKEISGHGIQGKIGDQEVLAGNLKLMSKMGVLTDSKLQDITDTVVFVAVNKKLVGYITIADEIKEDSAAAIAALHDRKIETIMLSGDKQSVVDRVASKLGIDKAHGDLLPEDKVKQVEKVKTDKRKVVVFVGDGINDAPVLALSDVGMAMGGLGSDAAIETADVIIQTDQPSRIAKAIQIGKSTNNVVWQNIGLAFIVKGVVMALGATGIATMWEAVFADVGVALLAVLNAMRIQRMKF